MPNQTQPDTAGEAITVEQLAAQLSRKTPPDAKAESGKRKAETTAARTTQNAEASDSETTVTEEAPVTTGTETEPDLSQSASASPAREATETEPELPLREQQTQAEVTAEAGPGEDETETPDWFKARMAKFTAKNKALEERLAAAEKRAEDAAAKLDETKRAQASGKTQAWNHAEQQLQQQLSHKRDLLRWAEENGEGATLTDDNGKETTYSPEQVRAIKLSALEDIGDLRGQLREHQAGLNSSRDHWDAEAVKAYPTLKDPNSEEARNIELMLEKLPWLREVPDARLSLADMLAGRAARLKKGTAAKAPEAKSQSPTRVPTTASAAPARTAEGEPSQEEKQAKEAFFQSGRTEDLARRFAIQNRK